MRPQTQGQAKHDFPVSGSCVRKLSSLTSRRLGAHDIMLCGLANVWRGPDGMGVRVTSIVLVTNTRQSQFSTLTIEVESVCGTGGDFPCGFNSYISSTVHWSGHTRVLTDALCSIVLVTGVRYAKDLSVSVG